MVNVSWYIRDLKAPLITDKLGKWILTMKRDFSPPNALTNAAVRGPANHLKSEEHPAI